MGWLAMMGEFMSHNYLRLKGCMVTEFVVQGLNALCGTVSSEFGFNYLDGKILAHVRYLYLFTSLIFPVKVMTWTAADMTAALGDSKHSVKIRERLWSWSNIAKFNTDLQAQVSIYISVYSNQDFSPSLYQEPCVA